MPRPLNVKLIDPPLPHFTDSFPLTTQHECGNWPRPFAVGDYAAVAMVLPFALDENLKGKIWVAVINIVIGLCIASLLSSVLSRKIAGPGLSSVEDHSCA
jgi:hypothetical protein